MARAGDAGRRQGFAFVPIAPRAMNDRRPVLGVIADDFTGATDVAGMLVQAGMNTLLAIGVPADPPRWMPTRWWWR